MGKLGWCESISIYVYKTMIKIFESLSIGFSFLDMNHKKISVSVNEVECSFLRFTCRHKTEHLNKHTRLELSWIFFWEFTPSIKSHFRYLIVLLCEKILIIQPDSEISLIKRQHARLEFLGCLHSSEHGIDNLIIKRLSHVKLNNKFSLIKWSHRSRMVNFHVVLDMVYLLRLWFIFG